MEKWTSHDQEMQMMMQRFNLAHPQFKCQNNFEIANICTNKLCKAKSALMCSSHDCPNCMKKHETCENVRFFAFTKLIEERIEIQKKLFIGIYRIQDDIINSIKEARQQFLNNYAWGIFDKRLQEVIIAIYDKKQKVDFSGEIARECLDRLRESQDSSSAVNNLLHQFQKQAKKIAGRMNDLTKNILNRFSTCPNQDVVKKKYITKDLNFPISLQKQSIFSLQSKIIPVQDQASLNFLYEALVKPKKVSLLFRASQHAFSVQKFHQICDYIPSTFTLIKTQFNKIIGGYTTLVWSSNQNSFVADEYKDSFLVSVSLRQKMNLINWEQAIFRSKNSGPFFGNKDIYIADKCNLNQMSHSSFPKSYNYTPKPYQKIKSTYKLFVGALENSSFGVKEYEVFKVSW